MVITSMHQSLLISQSKFQFNQFWDKATVPQLQIIKDLLQTYQHKRNVVELLLQGYNKFGSLYEKHYIQASQFFYVFSQHIVYFSVVFVQFLFIIKFPVTINDFLKDIFVIGLKSFQKQKIFEYNLHFKVEFLTKNQKLLQYLRSQLQLLQFAEIIIRFLIISKLKQSVSLDFCQYLQIYLEKCVICIDKPKLFTILVKEIEGQSNKFTGLLISFLFVQLLNDLESNNKQRHTNNLEILYLIWGGNLLYTPKNRSQAQSIHNSLPKLLMQFSQHHHQILKSINWRQFLQSAITFRQFLIYSVQYQHPFFQLLIYLVDLLDVFSELWRLVVLGIRVDNIAIQEIVDIGARLIFYLATEYQRREIAIKPPTTNINPFILFLNIYKLRYQSLQEILLIDLSLLDNSRFPFSLLRSLDNITNPDLPWAFTMIFLAFDTAARSQAFYCDLGTGRLGACEESLPVLGALVGVLLLFLGLFFLLHDRWGDMGGFCVLYIVYSTQNDIINDSIANCYRCSYKVCLINNKTPFPNNFKHRIQQPILKKMQQTENLSDQAVSEHEEDKSIASLNQEDSDKHVLSEHHAQSDALTSLNDNPKQSESNIMLDSTERRGSRCCRCLCCRGPDMNVERLVRLDGYTLPRNTISNAVNNQKYNILNFLPLVLFNQFKLFFNFFQLAINLSQFVPILKVGFLFSYLSPLVMVMLLTLGKEAYDDYKRYKRDKESNSSQYRLIKEKDIKMISSEDIRVGDVLELHAKDRVPADVVILSTSEHSGSIFIKTDQLDGQTDWKVRRSIRSTHHKLFHHKFQKIQGSILYAPACDDIYDFLGSYTNSETGKKQSLNLDNTAWANTVVAAGSMVAIVIFTGKETRSKMNSREPSTKIGRFDEEINHISKVLFVIMLILALIMNIFRQVNHLWPLYFFRYVLLLSSIIPISLRVNLDFCKTYFSYKISNDELIPGTICRNSAIPEELGRVEYLLSDKTGTLTYNDMVFKKLSVNEQLYTADQLEDIRKGSAKACKRFQGPLGDIHDPQIGMKKMKRRQQCILRDLLTSLILCNNVTPVVDEGVRILQASSPDQIALVKFAESIGFLMRQRDKNFIKIMNPADKEEQYHILANFPFSSETKRMGIIVKHQKTGRIMLYLKGADMVMIDRCKPIYRGYIQDQCDTLAREGLRTLVITQKELNQEEYNKWNIEYEQASNLLKNRHQATKQVMQKLQHEMDLIGITGVQDKLQDEVAATIEALRMGGIKVWMLTGDKVETAKCIAISAGLKSVNQEICEIKGDDQLMIRKKLLEYDPAEQVLLIDGSALTSILNSNNSSLFFQTAKKAPAVICCRCLPTQKALITEKLKTLTGTIVAGIGDGGNDVGMIQLASIGLGIVGKEGNHAALASDVSMKEFKHTKQILLWHGRNAYRRAAALSQFVIHRGLIISILQMAFSIIFYNVAIPIYNGMLMLGYATLYTSLPVFSLILDQDLSRQKTLMYPNLYINLRKSRQMNTKTFLIWLWMSIYQGLVIMVMSLSLFQQSFIRIVTITFTALILSQLLNVITTIHRMNRYIFGSIIITLIIYGLSLLLLRNYLNTSQIDLEFGWKVGAIVAVSWVPIFVVRCVKRRISPSEEDKIKN